MHPAFVNFIFQILSQTKVSVFLRSVCVVTRPLSVGRTRENVDVRQLESVGGLLPYFRCNVALQVCKVSKPD